MQSFQKWIFFSSGRVDGRILDQSKERFNGKETISIKKHRERDNVMMIKLK